MINYAKKNGGSNDRHDVFITLYSHNSANYFGEVINGVMVLNAAGEMAAKWAVILADEFDIRVDAFVIMPNHMHALLGIYDLRIDDRRLEQKLEQMMDWFMTITAREYHSGERKYNLIPVNGNLWKKEFSHHILKSAGEIQRAKQYITDNPQKWAFDAENRESGISKQGYYGMILGKEEDYG